MKKKSILFVSDIPNWAYHYMIKTWVETIYTDYDCFIAFAKDFSIRPKEYSYMDVIKNRLGFLLKNSYPKFYIHPSRKYSYPIYKQNPVYDAISMCPVDKVHFDAMIIMECYLQFTAELPFTADKTFVGLYTDSYPHEGPSYDFKNNIDLTKLPREEFFDKYISKNDGLIVGNYNLYNDYKKFNFPIEISNAAYKVDQFIENKNVGKNKTLTIGWTGNPNREMKGFRNIIEPAIKELQAEGLDIQLKTKFSGSYEDLLSFYQDVDLVCIASSSDTGPSLFAEASLCSVPAVSTRIGFPNTVIKNRENGLFIERNKEDLKTAIKQLYNDRNLLQSFSSRIKADHLKFFDNNLLISNLKKLLSTSF